MKYVVLSFHPLVFFYFFGSFFTFLALLFGVYALYFKFLLGNQIFIPAVVSVILFALGIQFVLFAMLFDMQEEKNSGWY